MAEMSDSDLDKLLDALNKIKDSIEKSTGVLGKSTDPSSSAAKVSKAFDLLTHASNEEERASKARLKSYWAGLTDSQKANSIARETARKEKEQRIADLQSRAEYRRKEKADEAARLSANKKTVDNVTALNKAYRAGNISHEQYQDALADNSDAIRALTKEDQRKLKTDGEYTAAVAKMTHSMKDGPTVMKGVFSKMSSVGGAVGGAVKDIISSISLGSSGVSIAAGALTTGIGLANSGMQAAASGVSTLGQTLFLAPMPHAKALGVAFIALGEGAKFLSGAFSDAAKFAINLAKEQFEKLGASYSEAASVGAIFAQGMGDLQKITADTGMSIEYFSKMTKDNAAGIAASGLTTAQGMKKFAEIFSGGPGNKLKNHLLNLGFSMEEGGEIISEVMQNMQMAGKDVLDPANNAEIRERTQDYAKNLRIISAITGEDAKAKLKQAKEQMTDLAWQAKLAGMSEAERRAQEQMLAAMNPAEQKAWKQKQTTGVISDENYYIANSATGGAIEKKFAAATEALKDPLTAVENFAKKKEQIDAQIMADMKQNPDKYTPYIMAQQHGKGVPGTDIMGEALYGAGKAKIGKTDAAVKAVDEVQKAIGIQAKKNEIDIQGMAIQKELQDRVISNLGPFADALIKVNNELHKLLKKELGLTNEERTKIIADYKTQQAAGNVGNYQKGFTGADMKRKGDAMAAAQKLGVHLPEIYNTAQKSKEMLSPTVTLASSVSDTTRAIEPNTKPETAKTQSNTQATKQGGSRSWRNNNPGNMEYGPYAISKGAIGSDGRFAIFPTLEMGKKAQADLLFAGKNYKNLDLKSAIARWAPSKENNTAAYQAEMLKSVGGENKKMSDFSTSERESLLAKMQQHEGFKEGSGTQVAAGEPGFTTGTRQTDDTENTTSMLADIQRSLGQLIAVTERHESYFRKIADNTA